MNVHIADIGVHLPSRIETADDLQAQNPDWPMAAILPKVGVDRRHVAGHEETALDLAVQAGEALFARGVDRGAVDGLILVTTMGLPAYTLQHRLGLSQRCMTFAIDLACSGFVYGLAVGAALLEAGTLSKVLIVCADTWTKLIAPRDRTCRPLFGDGAAAVLLEPGDPDGVGPFVLGTDGGGYPKLHIRPSADVCGECGASPPQVFMDGAAVMVFSMGQVPGLVKQTLDKAGLTVRDIDLFVFHQASKLVIDQLVRRLELPEDKVFRNYERRGNTVSATIPIALHDAAASGRLRRGQRVLLVGFGLGFSWGAAVVRW